MFIRARRLLPLATFVLVAALVAVWPGSLAGRVLAAGTWTSQTSSTNNNLNGVACPSTTACFAVGAGGTIVATTNGGSTWAIQGSGVTTNSLSSVACPSTTTCFVVGAGGTILDTTNGTSWSTQSSGVTKTLNGISCLSISTCYAVGVQTGNGQSKAIILFTNNGGTGTGGWTSQSNGPASNLNGIACLSTTTCFAVGASGTIVATTDGGNTWVSQTSGTTNSLSGITCLSASTCFAVGTGGTIVDYNGSSWTSQTVGTANLSGISCSASNNCFAVGASGTILNYNGSSWASQTSGTSNGLNGIACLSTGACYAIGASGTILSNGSLTESGPTATSATPVTLNGLNLTTTYSLGLTVVDTRGSGAGWNLTITSTTLTTGTHSLSNTASSINGTPSVTCNTSCTNPTNSVTYPVSVPAGTSAPTAVKFFNAASGTGLGSFTITPTITISIPANSFAGSYTTTVSVAIVNGP